MAKFSSGKSESGLPLPSVQSTQKDKDLPPAFLKRGKKRGREKGHGRARAQSEAMASMGDSDGDE